jgi:hypothetical protein
MQRGWILLMVACTGAILWQLRAQELRARAREEALMKLIARLPPAGPPASEPRTMIDSRAVNALSNRVAELVQHQHAEPAPAHAEPSAEQEAATQMARRQLDAVLSRGRIGRDDVLGLREQLAGAGPDEAFEIRRQIATAINTGRLVPEDPHFILP